LRLKIVEKLTANLNSEFTGPYKKVYFYWFMDGLFALTAKAGLPYETF